MSTENLKAVVETGIEAARRHAVGPEASVVLDRARRELDAIGQAAKSLKDWNDAGRPSLDASAARAWRLIESIATDAP